MRKVLVVVAMLLLMTDAAFGQGNSGNNNGNNGNHYGWGKHRTIIIDPGGGSTATASATAAAMSIANQWTNVQQSQSMQQNQTQTQSMGNVTTNLSGIGGSTLSGGNTTLSGVGSPTMSMESVPDFPQPYTTIPAAPLEYHGPFKSGLYEKDQPWLKRPKWMADEIDRMPNGGKVTAMIYNDTKPVKYVQPRDGREGYPEPASLMWHGNVYCVSKDSEDNPGTVWGGCAKVLLKKGCEFAYQIAGVITYGAASNAKNQSGGASLTGIFGQIFGFNAGGGASNTDHDAAPYERVNVTFACYGKLPEPAAGGK